MERSRQPAVTVVTVHPSYRRRGLLTEMMKHQLQDIHERGTEPVALLWASESAIYGRFGYGQASPQVRLTGKTKATAFRPDVDLGSGSVGEVERDQAIPIIQRLHQDLLPRRVGALNRSDDWWVVVARSRTVASRCVGVPLCAALRPQRPAGRLRGLSRQERLVRVRRRGKC